MNESSREEAIISAAKAILAADLPGFLARECQSDQELRRRVEQRLLGNEALLESENELTKAQARRPSVPRNETSGMVIGRYKVLEKIGEGGCGIVYMGEQQEPVKRRIALKLIKPGMDTRQVLTRFEAERQALAMMDHPNIAKVLDGGATEEGRPFFVMELVRGIKITDYCDQNNLSTEERLKLFKQVCHAVQHAHQKGIIHRDITPSNVLVTVSDGVPVPKVIDFGIAKAIEGRLTEKTLFTSFQQFIGTPAYMSPEQAEMSSLDIDTRSDIYSLGVLLYELLTGRTPLETAELMKAGVEEIRRAIREKEPPRPSTRLSSMAGEELTNTAKRRGAEPMRLVKLVRGDLDWIVMKCLEKDRTRRYETANGLAMDIQRYLNLELVLARPPSTLYRFQKMVRRYRLSFTAGATLAIAVLVAFAALCYMFDEERHSRNREKQHRLQAEAAEKTARAEAGMLGEALARLSNLPEAEKYLRDVIEMQRRILGQEELDVVVNLASVLQRQHKLTEAGELLRGALSRLHYLASTNFVGDASKAGLVLAHLADVRREEGFLDEARSLGESAWNLYRQHPDSSPTERQNAFDVVRDTLEAQGDLGALKDLCRQALTTDGKSSWLDSSKIGRGLFELATRLRSRDNVAEARDIEAELREIYSSNANKTATSGTPARLIGWWKCEGNGLDSTGAYHGRLLGSVETVQGIEGQALRFNGSDSGVEILNPPSPPTLSVAAWVMFDSLDSSRRSWAGLQFLVFRKNKNANGFQGFVLAKERRDGGHDRLVLEMIAADSQYSQLFSTNDVETGTFYHIAATFDGSWACLYVNGVLHALAPHPYPIDYGSRPLFFGTSGEQWDGRFAGIMDEVRLYSGALSPAQVAEIFAAGHDKASRP